MFFKFGGIKLLNNDGNEIIKNAIIHDNSNYGIIADTESQ